MEEAIAKQLALVLLEDRRDQWNNIIQSPIVTALDEYYRKNEVAITNLIVSKFTNEQVADLIAKKLGDRYSWDAKELETKVKERLVNILAEQQLAKLLNN